MFKVTSLILIVLGFSGCPTTARAGGAEDAPAYLRDRGPGQPTSMFATYVRRGELLIYPFFECYLDNNIEYKPAELGYELERDFRGKYRAYEGLIFLCYGFTDWLAVELEAAVIDATLEKSSQDPSATPKEIHESGTGDVEGQVRLRWLRERVDRPEFFSYFEAVSRQQKDKVLIGTPDWELKLGSGLTKGFPWGTLSGRLAVEYTLEDSTLELGEYAVEYVRRLSPAWRVYFGFEGAQDEIELITEVQRRLTDHAFVKVNNAFGVTSKATDWAPEVGVMFSLSGDGK